MIKKFDIKCRTLAAALVLIMLILPIASCGRGSENPDTGEGVTFTDALGRQVTVPENPKRVAALIGSFADVWMLSGGELCAAAEDAWSDFGLELPEAVNIGGAHSPSLELLLSASPDFVIASASTASNVKLRDALEGAGITVAYFDVDNFDDYLGMLDICTSITGRRDLYEQNGSDIKAEIEGIKAKYQSANIPDEERTVLLLRVSASSIKAKGSRGTILGEMLSNIGCINIADSDTSLLENLSVESVIRKNPYRIFAVAMGDDNETARGLLDNMIKENPAWGTLPAVTAGRIHLMDKHLFNLKPNSRWAEAYQKLYETLTDEKN